MDKFMWYLLTAGKKALEDAGMTSAVLDSLDKSKCGILIGSAMGGMQVKSGSRLSFFFSFFFSVAPRNGRSVEEDIGKEMSYGVRSGLNRGLILNL